MAEKFLTLREAAALWLVSPQTVRNWGRKGFVRVVRLSGRVPNNLHIKDPIPF